MKPSTVIKVACGLLIGFGFLQLWGLLAPLYFQHRQRTILSDPFNLFRFALLALPSLALGAWAFATALGLLRRRAWARPSVIALCLVGVFGFLGGVATALFASIPNYPELPKWFPLAIYGSFLGTGGVSAVLVAEFSATRMDEVFQSSLAPRFGFLHAVVGDKPAPGPAWSAIPLSISVIAMWLILVWPLGLYEHYFRVQGLASFLVPTDPPGIALYGSPKIFYLLAMAAVGIATGIGLLRMKEWARITALALCAYSVAGIVFFAIRPNAYEAMAEWMNALRVSISPGFFWLSLIWAMLPAACASYFLIKRKEFFRQPSAP